MIYHIKSNYVVISYNTRYSGRLEITHKGISILNNDAQNEVNTLWFTTMKILRTFFQEHKEFNVANLYNDYYWYYNEYRWKPKE